MTPEGRVKEAVKKLLNNTSDLWYFMPVGGMLGRAGVPDFIVCHKGQFLAIETKAGKGKPTALQKLTMQQITAAYGIAIVINEKNICELENILYATSEQQSDSVSREQCNSGKGAWPRPDKGV